MPRNPRVYVGNLSSRMRQRDLEYLCEKYGRVRDVAVLDGFAFVEFDDPYDAEDAIRALDGYEMDGRRLSFQEARGPGRGGFGGGFGGGRGRGGYDNGYGGGGGGGGGFSGGGRYQSDGPVGSGQIGGRVRGSRECCIIVEGIGPRTTWKDLKDWARISGRVEYTDIWEERGKKFGIVKYETRSDFKEALSRLDDTKLDGHYVRVREDGATARRRSGSRSRSRSRRSRSKHSDTRSRSRSNRRRSSSVKRETLVKEEGRRRSRSRSKSRGKNKMYNDNKRSPSRSKNRSRSPRKDSRSRSRSNKRTRSRSRSKH